MVLCLALLAPVSLLAGPLEPQPDRVNFGRVNVGAVAEASAMVMGPGGDVTGLSVKVEPPPFVRVDRVHIDQQDYGQVKKVRCGFEIHLDTRKAGELKGDITIEFAGGKHTIPVTATVAEPRKGQTRVLIVETPFQMYATGDAKVFEPWLDVVKAADLDVQYWLARADGPVFRGDTLEKFDVVLLSEGGLFHFQDEDRKRLRRFVELGGRLIVGANAFMVGSVERANKIVSEYGIKLLDEEQAFGQNVIVLGKDRLVADPFTKDIDKLYFHRASPISVTNPKKAKLLTQFDDNVGVVAVARMDPGEVVVIGESMWWLWINRPAAQSDNAKMLRLLMTKPVK
jgi:hypothetical protein